jgi:signal transduction histidine kinase
MEIALLATIIFGLYAIYLSYKNDLLQKKTLDKEKAEKDRLYKLSVIKDIQGKIAYATDPEKIIDTIMVSLQNFYNYSTASSMIIKDTHVLFKIYIEDKIGSKHIEKVKENMLSSFEKLVGKLPHQIEEKTYGKPIDDSIDSTYSSSFHIPLIANNKVLALIYLSSVKENAYSNMEDLRELIDSASSALTHFKQAVDEETERFFSLINSLEDGVFMIDNKNNLLTINDSAKKLLGISGNTDFLNINSIFPYGFCLEDKIQNVISSKKQCLEKEIQVADKILNIFINPIEQDKASIILRDISEYKKKELQKEDLIHIMVHELRNPMTAIKDSMELIITSKGALEKEKEAKFMEIIHQQSKKALSQISSILDTAKLDAGKLILVKTKGDIAKTIENETKTFVPQAERKKISLRFEALNKDIPEIFYDEIRISQVIDNLLSNSLKFTPENGKIKVELDYNVLSPTTDGLSPMKQFLSLDKYIIVSVSDDGIGIKPEQQKLLFSKYTQAKNTSEEIATKGTGLGLYLAKGIVEAHEGRIWVKSAQGKGTTFFFALPTTDVAKTSEETSKPATTPLGRLSQVVN